jgi:hypothetical protein
VSFAGRLAAPSEMLAKAISSAVESERRLDESGDKRRGVEAVENTGG